MILNLALRFILEICALAALAYWGFHTGNGLLMKLVLGIGSPLLIAVIWGVFGSPAAPLPLKGILRFLLEILIFGLATFALFATRETSLAIIFAILVVLNRILMHLWDQ